MEKQHDIRILMAVSYGSRCLGYASPESDWDVRFIYVHRPEWYFSIAKTEDVITLIQEEEHLDIEGYDLKKALTLLSKTNPTVSDWLHANDYYILDKDFLQTILSIEAQCYNVHHALYHFYSISSKHYKRYLEQEVTLKRFIYFMRGLLSCRWVEQRGCQPPVNVDELIDSTVTDNEHVRENAHRLLELKRTDKSHDMETVDAELSDYVFELKKRYENLLPSYAGSELNIDLPSLSRFLMKVALQQES